MTRYLALIGDVVIGVGNSATEAILDARQRADAIGHDLEQAGGVRVEQVPDSQRYLLGSTIDWADTLDNDTD